jgi:hypothetical protein
MVDLFVRNAIAATAVYQRARAQTHEDPGVVIEQQLQVRVL